MSLLDSLGVQAWSADEYQAKESAITQTPRPIVSVTRGIAQDEYIVSAPNFQNDTEAFVHQTAALNAVLAWLNCPDKVRPFIDSVLAVCADTGFNSFTATDLEIGKQMRVGRNAKAESVSRRITRAKTSLLEWQNELHFDVIGIERGKFDPVKKRNEPTRYTPFILEWVIEIVHIASASDKWHKGKNHQLKEIRRAARDYLNSKPQSPPLRGYQPKTFTEEQTVNRTVRRVIGDINRLRNQPVIKSQPKSLHRLLVAFADQECTNPTGSVGSVLTPSKDEPNKDLNFYKLFESGEIDDVVDQMNDGLREKFETLASVDYDHIDYAVAATAGEERNVIVPQIWQDGEFVEVENKISTKLDAENGDLSTGQNNFENDEKTVCNSLKINDASTGHFVGENEQIFDGFSEGQNNDLSAGHFDDFDGFEHVGGTFSDDFTDWKNEAEGVAEIEPPTVESLTEIFNEWFHQTAVKLPDATPAELQKGVWQFYRLDSYTLRQHETTDKLSQTMIDIASGNLEFSAFKPAAIDYLMARVLYYQCGTITPQSPERINKFREGLEKFLQLPDEFSDG